jgi:hypothetical protein
MKEDGIVATNKGKIVIICDTEFMQRLTKSWWRPNTLGSNDLNLTNNFTVFPTYIV